jgi:hypothetical protein
LLAFELDQYLTQCVDQLDADILTPLLKLNYSVINDTMAELVDAVQVRPAFVGCSCICITKASVEVSSQN